MKKYRRNRQISDHEIEAFKEREIEKIKAGITSSPSKKRPERILLFAKMSLGIALLVVGLFLFWPEGETPANDTHTFTKLNETAYIFEVEEEAFGFSFYYDFDIVKQGERKNHDDVFDYHVPFLYASESIVETFDIELNLFKYDMFNYYLEIVVNDDVRYLEVNYFKHHHDSMMLDHLAIEDFEADLKALNTWLEDYPPVQVDANVDIFAPHPDVASLEDSREKANYLAYVEHYYTEENTYGEEDIGTSPKPAYILQRHQLLVGDEGRVIDTDFVTAYAYGEVDSLPEHLQEFNHNRFFAFYPVGRDRPYSASTLDYDKEIHGFHGFFRMQRYEEETPYIYSAIYLDHAPETFADVHSVTIDYTLTETFDNDEGTFTEETFIYNRALILPPQLVPVELSEPLGLFGVFSDLEIRLFDEAGDLVHSFSITAP